VDPSRGRGKGGAGIGLAIVRELVDAHGGSVGAASDEHGVTIWFELPLAPSEPAEAVARRVGAGVRTGALTGARTHGPGGQCPLSFVLLAGVLCAQDCMGFVQRFHSPEGRGGQTAEGASGGAGLRRPHVDGGWWESDHPGIGADQPPASLVLLPVTGVAHGDEGIQLGGSSLGPVAQGASTKS